MRIDVLTLFPEVFGAPLGISIVGRAQANNIVDIRTHDIRRFSRDKHGKVDDRPYGGGPGMVLSPAPVFEAVEDVIKNCELGIANGFDKEGAAPSSHRIILMTPQGAIFSQEKARALAGEKHLIMICGRYEGIDERVRERLVTDEISIGDYVISGGELAAMVVIEAVVRLLPGALGGEGSAEEDSFSPHPLDSSGDKFLTGLEYPQYTRPAEYRGMEVPSVLRSGDHAEIRKWRRREALRRTVKRRPDILEKLELTEEDREFLKGLRKP
jgi:tRNA (guanine37-N1)-methyltransferase